MNRTHLFVFFSSLVMGINFAKEEGVIYITPSVTTGCYTEPCFTLSHFAENHSQPDLLFFNTTLIVMPGNHTLSSTFLVTSIKYFSMLAHMSMSPFIIECQCNVSFEFQNIDYVLLKGLTFIGCGGNKMSTVNILTVNNCSFIGQKESGTALEIVESSAFVINASFLFNEYGSYRGPIGDMVQDSADGIPLYYFVGGAMIINQSSVDIVGSRVEGNRANVGGAIFGTGSCNITITDSLFTDNYACLDTTCYGGVLYIESNFNFKANRSEIFVSNSVFNSNGGFSGGVLLLCNSTAFITQSQFFNNYAISFGGAFGLIGSTLTISESRFWNNTVHQFGGAIGMSYGTLIIYKSEFNGSIAFQGGVLYVYRFSSISVYDSKFTNNIAEIQTLPLEACGGGIIVGGDTNLSILRSQFYSNTATGSGGVLCISSNTKLTLTNSSFIGNHAIDGGVLKAYLSIVIFRGWNNLSGNSAVNGGAIIASADSVVNVYDELTMTHNTANDSGGGFYLHRSKLNCRHNCTLKLTVNQAAVKGGGICGINSIVNVYSDGEMLIKSSIHFVGNSAQKGGGIYSEMSTDLHVIKSGRNDSQAIYNLRFIANSAEYGGAIYVADETNIETCIDTSYYSSFGRECFLQIIIITETRLKYNVVSIEFANNTASVSGAILYGGLLDRCTLSSRAEILYTRPPKDKASIDGVTFFLNSSSLPGTNEISSSPVKVCFCLLTSVGTRRPDCSIEKVNISTMKGDRFTVSLVAVDHVNKTTSNTTIYVSLKYAESGLGEGEMVQMTGDTCTDLNLSVYSSWRSEEITLYADGPCRNAARSQKKVFISFLNCTCPIGFKPSDVQQDSCSCNCDPKLQQYVSNCRPQTKTVTRKGDCWITYLNNTDPEDGYNYLTYPHCPLDYCQPTKMTVHINLSRADGADAQCVGGRSGTLCGVCKPGLSLSLGTSRCITCTNGWPKDFIIVITGALVAGVCLVAVMLVLNLTVAIGTLNGLIFYANIIGANSNLFFPSSVPHFKIYFAFISWLNLDIGIDVCFFHGMDTYWKTWIQLAFPTYVICLVVLVIQLSKHSFRFTGLISKKNPVATLATLILLSYTKFLRMVIIAMSYVRLGYPDGLHTLWQPDATVSFLTGRHIVLFVVAILILILGIVYTFMLFSWQWLLRIKWINRYQALNHFVEVYHAPYEVKHRYWTGLLLLTRVLLYLVFAVGTPSLNLLVSFTVTCSLLFFKAYFGQIYKSRGVDVIEMINYLNIALFSAAKFFTFEIEKYQSVMVSLSVFVTVIVFIIVLSYHIHVEVSLKLWKRFKQMRSHQCKYVVENQSSDMGHVEPTSSTIDGLPCVHTSGLIPCDRDAEKNNELSPVASSQLASEGCDDDASFVDSSTPLLYREGSTRNLIVNLKYV